jgi:hypothetical protein
VRVGFSRNIGINMSTITRRLALTLSCFLLGVGVGILAIPHSNFVRKTPVNADFCFLARNPDIFESRRFVTYASVSSIQPHGYVLVNAQCPDIGVPFVVQRDHEELYEELRQKFRDDPYTSVPILFEGTVYVRSALAIWWYVVKVRMHLSGGQAPDGTVTIRAYKAVGEETWDPSTQSWRSAHP